MLKLGTVSLDGTKVHANASRHSAMSYGHAKKLEAKLKAEVAELKARGVDVKVIMPGPYHDVPAVRRAPPLR